YNSNGWLNIPYEDVHPTTSDVTDIVRVTVNPSNPNQIYLSSYFNGLVKFENDVLTQVYNETNSGLESIFTTDPATDNLRIEQSVFDRNGNLWMTNGLVKTAIKVLTPSGTWQAFNVEGILDSYMET